MKGVSAKGRGGDGRVVSRVPVKAIAASENDAANPRSSLSCVCVLFVVPCVSVFSLAPPFSGIMGRYAASFCSLSYYYCFTYCSVS